MVKMVNSGFGSVSYSVILGSVVQGNNCQHNFNYTQILITSKGREHNKKKANMDVSPKWNMTKVIQTKEVAPFLQLIGSQTSLSLGGHKNYLIIIPKVQVL